MNPRNFKHASAPLVALAALALAGCDVDRATANEPFGDIGYGTRLTPAANPNLPNGTVSRNTASDSVFIRVAGIETLAPGNAYHVWFGTFNSADSTVSGWVPAVGNLRTVTYDTTGVDPASGQPVVDSTTAGRTVLTPGVSSFSLGGPRVRQRLAVPQTVRGTRNVVLITIEDGAPTEPDLTGPRPLWVILPATLTTAGTAMSFGTFNPRPNQRYVFGAVGRGVAMFRGGVLSVADTALARPPVGYYYATALIKRDDDGVVTDTLFLGAQTAPYPRRTISLREADVSQPDPVVLVDPPTILAAANRLLASEAGLTGTLPFAGFADVVVSLEAKAGLEDTLAPSFVLTAPVPGVVRTAPSGS